MEGHLALRHLARRPAAARDESVLPVGLRAVAATVHIRSASPLEIVDLTPRVEALLAASGMTTGMVNVQSRHTTTGIVVNENEPLLLADLAALLDRLAPRDNGYAHDELHRRPGVPADERPNGHAHAKASLLRTAETVNVVGGRLQLGRWQRLLFVELDGPREREISLVALGEACS
jgi:secondary thiamine-phosphate synthase enzyme